MRAYSSMQKQAGVALFVCLMILLVLSLLGVSAMRMVTSQNMISTSSQGADIAFDAAETGINRAIVESIPDGVTPATVNLPVSPGDAVTVTYPKDNRNIASINVTISMPDPTSNPTLGKNALAAIVAFGAVPGVVVEQFRYESKSTVDALDISTTHVQDTIYPHL